MFCRKCGTQLPDDALFCSNCGEKTNVSGAIEPNANAANTNVSSGNGNGNKNIIIGVIVAAIVACCAFFYINYNSSFVPDFVSKDLKFTWNDDLDSISKRYPKWTFKKENAHYLVQPSITNVSNIKVEKTLLFFTKDNNKKLKTMSLPFAINNPKFPKIFDEFTEERLPDEIIRTNFALYNLEAGLLKKKIQKDIEQLTKDLNKYCGNTASFSSNDEGLINTKIDKWTWMKGDTKIQLRHLYHTNNIGSHHLVLVFSNPKYNVE